MSIDYYSIFLFFLARLYMVIWLILNVERVEKFIYATMEELYARVRTKSKQMK